MDAIVIAPIVEDGWDDVLQEAKDADIPVILEDRTVTAPPTTCTRAGWVSTSRRKGVTAGEWAAETVRHTDTKMVVLEGTTGSGSGQRPRRGVRRGHRRHQDREDRLADRRLHP